MAEYREEIHSLKKVVMGLAKKIQEKDAQLAKQDAQIQQLEEDKAKMSNELEALKRADKKPLIEAYYDQRERASMKNPQVEDVYNNDPRQDYQRTYSHYLNWWFTPSSPWTHTGSYRRHTHNQKEVFYVLEGTLVMNFNGVRNVAVPGEKLEVPAGAEHDIPDGSPYVKAAIVGGG